MTLDAAALGGAAASPVSIGVALGLLLGKPIGITGFSWLAVRFGIGALPRGATWPALGAVAVIGGIGFTMALFIASLAFPPGSSRAAPRRGQARHLRGLGGRGRCGWLSSS